jgi:hypothetical protein
MSSWDQLNKKVGAKTTSTSSVKGWDALNESAKPVAKQMDIRLDANRYAQEAKDANSIGGLLKNTLLGIPKATGIGDAFMAGVDQTKQGFNQTFAPQSSLIQRGEGILNTGAGVINTAFSPLAPVFAPIGKGVQYAGDKLAETQYMQDVGRGIAETQPGQSNPERILNAIVNASTIAGAVAPAFPKGIRLTNPSIKLPVKSDAVSTNIPIRTPLAVKSLTPETTRVNVDTPYLAPDQMPVIDYGKPAPKVKSNLPTIDFESLINETKTPVLAKSKQVNEPKSSVADPRKYKSAEEFVKGQEGKYKTTINIQRKEDLEYLGRIFGRDSVEDIKNGKMTNWRGDSYEDLGKVNIVSFVPKTTAQELVGRIKPHTLKSNVIFHGTSPETAGKIKNDGFKVGSALDDDAFRGGGYDAKQNSISFSTDPMIASNFTGTGSRGALIKTTIKPNAKVVTVDGIDYAEDLNKYVKDLRKQGIDAVYIEGEKEIAVINKAVIDKISDVKEFDVFNKKSQLTDIWKKDNETPKVVKPVLTKQETTIPIKKEPTIKEPPLKYVPIKEKTPLLKKPTKVENDFEYIPEKAPKKPLLQRTTSDKPVKVQKTGAITRTASNVNQELVKKGYDALPVEEQSKYTPQSYKAQANKIASMMDEGINNVADIATGRKPVPNDINGQILFNTVEAYAMKTGDVALLQELASSPLGKKLSEAAQQLGGHGYNDNPNSPIGYMQDIQRARSEAVAKKIDVSKEKGVIIKQIKETLKKNTVKKETWNSFIDSITC